MQNDPLLGKQVGAYLIQQKIGEGGMATVYKAYHARLHREVAIKVIAPHIADQADFQARFEREAQVIASLEHHNIVAVYDFGEAARLTYLVMQFVGGGTLRERLRPGQPLDYALAANYAIQMARALHHAHQRGIVHRDVKPQNMLVSASDPRQLLLSDFGIAKLFDNSPEPFTLSGGHTPIPDSLLHNSALTSASQIIGTAEYMAPEQIQNQPIDARTDVYALGAVLYQMLTGRTPFQATNSIGLMYQHLNTPPPPVRSINPQVPEMLAMVAETALAKAPGARFQSAEAMARALELAIAASATTQVPSQSFAGPATNPGVLASYPRTSATTYTIEEKTLKTRSPRLRRIQTIVTPIVILLAIALLVWRLLPLLPSSSSTPPTTTGNSAQTFTETFQNNQYAWTVGTINSLTGTIHAGTYTLQVSDGNTHFPSPRAAGALPNNFTLSTTLSQTAGATNLSYGLVFYLTSSDQQSVSCYAFVIESSGNYGLLKYTAQQANPDVIDQGTSPVIKGVHYANTLKMIAQNGSFQFAINGQPIQIKGQTTITDTTHHEGTLGLLVSGPGTFVASQVQLTIPR